MDWIHIRDLLVRGVIGINDWERETAQDILINLSMAADTRPAGDSDSIEDTVNYRTVSKQVQAHIAANQPQTVERLARDLAEICLQMEGVQRVRVTVEKPGALRFARSVGVEIERTRDRD